MGSIRCPKCKMVSLAERGNCPRCGYDFSRLRKGAAPAVSRPVIGMPAAEPRIEPRRPRLPALKTLRRTLASSLIRARHGLREREGAREFPKSPIASLSTPHPLPRRTPPRPTAPPTTPPTQQYRAETGVKAITAEAAKATATATLEALASASSRAWELARRSFTAAADLAVGASKAVAGAALKAADYVARSVTSGVEAALYALNVFLVALLVGFAKLKSGVQSLAAGVARRLKRQPVEMQEEFRVEKIPLVSLREAQLTPPEPDARPELELPTIEPDDLEPVSLAETTRDMIAEAHLPAVQKVVTEYAPLSMVLESVEAAPAGILSRALAGLADILLIAAAVLIFLVPAWLAGAFDFLAIAPNKFATVTLSIYLFALATAGVYHVVATAAYGQTLGKKLFGIRVIDISGEPLGLIDAAVRFSAWLISGLFFGLGWLWLAFDLNHRGLHDYLAQTVVIKDVAKV